MKIYLDHSATTPLDERVLKKMIPYMTDVFGNASGLHSYGREALSAVDEARDTIARCIGCLSKEIYFTSGGTESDNWALRGILSANKNKGKHVITSSIEHPAVINICKQLEKEGYDVTFLPVNGDGIIMLEDLAKAVRNDTVLVSVMYANNEIGSIQPIAEIGRFCREKGIIFHTDAVQAIGNIHVDVRKDNIDLLSFSSHKFYGPKGIGVLYVREGVRIDNLILGGEQERAKRAGTVNTPGIVGTAEALRLAVAEIEENNIRIHALCDHFITRVENEIPFVRLNGSREKRLPGNANFTFDYVENDALLTMLDLNGIAVSAGSACTAGSTEPSHVLIAIGRTEVEARNSIRFSFGKNNTTEETDRVVEVLKRSVETLRKKSVLFKKLENNGYEI